MRTIVGLLVLAALVASPARAVPPTVSPSPGYDARLQEQRAAASAPAATVAKPAVSPHRKRRAAH